jgi:hypothetical protein
VRADEKELGGRRIEMLLAVVEADETMRPRIPKHWTMILVKSNPYRYTQVFLALGTAALLLWIVTFERGLELSSYFFPLSEPVARWIYPYGSVPAGTFYASPLGQWILVGVVIDVLRLNSRWAYRKKRQSL